MKTRQLFILRHAKSDWAENSLDDVNRPLSNRGETDAPRIGQWMLTNQFKPETIISSPALRAKQTVQAISQVLALTPNQLTFDKRLYLADLQHLLEVISQCPPTITRLLIAGHNPGLETLLRYLCPAPLPLTNDGQLFTTANLAVVSLSQPWDHDLQGHGELLQLIRPRDLDT